MPTVALFITCVADQLFPDTGMATVRLLEAAGVTVEFPVAQTCCGQPALTGGDPEAAARLARHHVDVFAQYDAIVAPSGSCAAMVRHHYKRLLPDRAATVDVLAKRTFELTEYLVHELGVDDIGARLDTMVTIHDACHGLRTLGLGGETRQLLAKAGARIEEMEEADTCCGFGGVFALGYPEVSTRLADAKLGHAHSTDAEFCVMTDLACLMHLDGRREKSHVGPPVIHIADLLASGLPA